MRRSLAGAGNSRPGTQAADDDVFDFDDDAPAHTTQLSQVAPAAHTDAVEKSSSGDKGAQAIEQSARPAGGGEAGGTEGRGSWGQLSSYAEPPLVFASLVRQSIIM